MNLASWSGYNRLNFCATLYTPTDIYAQTCDNAGYFWLSLGMLLWLSELWPLLASRRWRHAFVRHFLVESATRVSIHGERIASFGRPQRRRHADSKNLSIPFFIYLCPTSSWHRIHNTNLYGERHSSVIRISAFRRRTILVLRPDVRSMVDRWSILRQI